jgi:ubiquitin C-terminal hydrolase
MYGIIVNSTLQCLSNTPGLTDYFLEKKHIPQINRENPLGWGGKVADAYGTLSPTYVVAYGDDHDYDVLVDVGWCVMLYY